MFSSLFLRMLNWEASLPNNRAREIIESLQVREGMRIADIGSGGGYFTLEFARIVGETGRVYAVDNKPKNLDFVRKRAKQAGLDNIVIVLPIGSDVGLPEGGLDLIFARNVFHHLPEAAGYFQSLKRFLKASGKVAIIDHKPKGGFSFTAMFKHHTPVEVILRTMESAGYSLVQTFDFLPEQTFNLFGVK
ncbi:MAG: class I SAM-dependent methyltransferase [Anaerolineae bacterium]